MGLLIKVDADELHVGRMLDFLYCNDDDQIAAFPFGKPMNAILEWATKPRSFGRITSSSLEQAVLSIDRAELDLRPRLEFQIRGDTTPEQNYRTWEIVNKRDLD